MQSSDLIEIIFSWDTTGSMYAALSAVKATIESTVQRLFKDLPNLRVGLIAHGDYCDVKDQTYNGVTYPATYLLKKQLLSTNVPMLSKFIQDAGKTCGGDSPEAYELVLHEARKFNWSPNAASKVLVMIGDENPHGAYDAANESKLDWRTELKSLLTQGVKVYGVHCMPGQRQYAKVFWEEMASITGGHYLTLDQFSSITQLLMAIAYQLGGGEHLNRYAQELAAQGKLDRSTQSNLAKLGSTWHPTENDVFGAKVAKKFGRDVELIEPSRFQRLTVPYDQRIDEFVEAQGLEFRLGRGFYQLTVPVKISSDKEIILQHKLSGDFYAGGNARNIVGIPSGYDLSLKKSDVLTILNGEYRVFVQSNSNNRKLLGGTDFLYEAMAAPALAGVK